MTGIDQSQGLKSARTADRQQTDRVGDIMKAFCTSYSGFKKSMIIVVPSCLKDTDGARTRSDQFMSQIRKLSDTLPTRWGWGKGAPLIVQLGLGLQPIVQCFGQHKHPVLPQ